MSKKKPDNSPKIHQNSKIKNQITIFDRELTEKQKELLKILLDKNTKMVFISGCAGTSKTFCAVLALLYLLNDKKISNIHYIRAAVESSSDAGKLGFLPGSITEKLEVYSQPFIDKLNELIPKSSIDTLKKDGRIQMSCINYIRGVQYNALGLLLDEAQCCTRKNIISLITRQGPFSKMIIAGDPEQSDIKNEGFTEMYNLFDDQESRDNGIFTFKFDENDVLRSDLVRFITTKLRKQKSIS